MGGSNLLVVTRGQKSSRQQRALCPLSQAAPSHKVHLSLPSLDPGLSQPSHHALTKARVWIDHARR